MGINGIHYDITVYVRKQGWDIEQQCPEDDYTLWLLLKDGTQRIVYYDTDAQSVKCQTVNYKKYPPFKHGFFDIPEALFRDKKL